MADEQDKEGENAQSAKKEGKISGFFKKVGDKFNDATYDLRAESDFNKNHDRYTVYTGAQFTSRVIDLYGSLAEEDGQTVFTAISSDDQVKAGCIIEKFGTEEARYIQSVEKTTYYFDFEGKTNQKPALKIVIGEPAECVEVIKAGDRYYLKKQ